MRALWVIVGSGALFGCSSLQWKPQSSAVLPGFTAQVGAHCESSAMLNLLHYQGYNLEEADLIGAGAALGFYMDGGAFPFLGGRTMTLRENIERTLGIPWSVGTRGEFGDGWAKIYELLTAGNPVVLRVDMRFLPYLYGGHYGSKNMSFGAHYICLTGLDAETGTALVTDTANPGLQRISFANLHKARFSDTKMMPPEGEFYWTGKAPASWAPDWEGVARASLNTVAKDMEGSVSKGDELLGLDGMRRWPAMLAAFDQRVKPYLLAPVLGFHYGCIETNGTGGAAFRRLYTAFLQRVGRESGNAHILGAAERLAPARDKWTALALAMKDASEKPGLLKSTETRKETLRWLSTMAGELVEAESAFYRYASCPQ